MTTKLLWLALVIPVLMIGTGVTNSFPTGELVENLNVPRYSEVCLHGHNGYDCDPTIEERKILKEKRTLVESH